MASAASILVVEDDQALRELVTLLLEEQGYDVADAPNGRVALAKIALRMPDLILLDMRMPVMDGWEFARVLRAIYTAPPPIMVMTASESTSARAAEIGADAWIAKPFELADLLRVIRAQMMKRKQKAA